MIFYSSFESYYLWLPLVGFLVGLLATMVGGGGGFVFPPILMLLFAVPAQIAVPTSLVATVPICFVGALGHYRKGNIDLRTGFIFGIAGMLGAFAGAAITGLITPAQLRTAFGIYSVLLSLLMVYRNRLKSKNARVQESEQGSSRANRITKSSIYGFVAGVITGIFGTSGTATVLAGLFALRMPFKVIVGTSLLIILINTLSAVAGHFLVGEIDLTLLFMLTAGTITGALTGPVLLAGVKIEKMENSIRITFAAVIFIFGILMLLK
jgi:uncharacterized protein